ncbi:MAG: hypothetical protein P1U40_01340 [Coxiellaceae bacterium]|nr:hypothetical protein [Coxiellaceae bacterium]
MAERHEITRQIDFELGLQTPAQSSAKNQRIDRTTEALKSVGIKGKVNAAYWTKLYSNETGTKALSYAITKNHADAITILADHGYHLTLSLLKKSMNSSSCQADTRIAVIRACKRQVLEAYIQQGQTPHQQRLFYLYLQPEFIQANFATQQTYMNLLSSSENAQNAFATAIDSNDTAMIKLLKKCGYRITSETLYTAIASDRCTAETYQAVVAACDRVTLNSPHKPDSKITPLMQAVTHGRTTAIKALGSDRRVKQSTKNSQGHTAYSLAKAGNQADVCRLMKSCFINTGRVANTISQLEQYKSERLQSKNSRWIATNTANGKKRDTTVSALIQSLRNLQDKLGDEPSYTPEDIAALQTEIQTVEKTGGSTAHWKRSLVSIFGSERSHFDDIVMPLKRMLKTASEALSAEAQQPVMTAPVA